MNPKDIFLFHCADGRLEDLKFLLTSPAKLFIPEIVVPGFNAAVHRDQQEIVSFLLNHPQNVDIIKSVDIRKSVEEATKRNCLNVLPILTEFLKNITLK